MTAEFDNDKLYVTPVGTLVFPNLNVPRDYKGNGKFAYDTQFDLEGEEALELERQVQEIEEEAKRRAKARRLGSEIITPGLDENKEEIPGTLRFRFKVNTGIETKKGIWDRKPLFFQADGTPYETEPKIGGGTLAQICFKPYFWSQKAGVTLELLSLRIHELVEFRGARRGVNYGDVDWGTAKASTRSPRRAQAAQQDEDF